MLVTGGTTRSHRFFLTALSLISVLFGNSLAGRTSSSESSFEIAEKKHYRPVPLLKYHSSEEYNPFDSHDILRYPHDRRRPSSASNEFNQKYFGTKPIPFAVTKSTEKSTYGKTYPGNRDRDCPFGKNCVESQQFLHKVGQSLYDSGDVSAYGEHKTQTSAIPFTVTADQNADGLSLSTRRTRTTTPSTEDNWVKLQPLAPPRTYDPFSIARNGSSEDNSTSLFASRSGVELNPETFAERHGWKDGKYAGGGGNKLPAWLEELNYQHGGYGPNRRQGYGSGSQERDPDDNRWVKLEAIPVAGVKISKWVPKNTAPSELPSTNWKHPSKPSWWDRMDGQGNPFPNHHSYGQQHSRPSAYHPQQSSSSWPQRYHQNHHQHTDSWNDVIYPNSPISATASWANDQKASSSSSMPSSLGWPKNPHPGTRYPVASWSSNDNNRPATNNFGAFPFPRPQSSAGNSPPFYPDSSDGKDDQQWVLISSTKNNQSPPKSPYGDFPYNFNNNRHSKFINISKFDKFGSPGHILTNRPVMTQDELFRRTNATLFSLRPVLGGKKGSYFTTESPQLSQTLIDMLTSTAANIVESTTMKYNNIGLSRESSTAKRSVTTVHPSRKKRVMPEVNPAIASVGAGMLPTTFGAVIPMVFGRKRREVGTLREVPKYRYFMPVLKL